MCRHHHHRIFAWILGAVIGTGTFAGAPVKAAQAADSAEFSVAVVTITVREANGRVYRAKTRAIRMGDAASFEVISDLHRHEIKVSAGE